MISMRKAVKSIFVPDKPKVPDLPTPQEDEKKAREASQEADRKARAALAAQEAGGRKSTLVGALTTQAGIASKRRTLGGV